MNFRCLVILSWMRRKKKVSFFGDHMAKSCCTISAKCTKEKKSLDFFLSSSMSCHGSTFCGIFMLQESNYSDLIIHHAQTDHSGNYTCAPSNMRPASVVVVVLQSKLPLALVSLDPADIILFQGLSNWLSGKSLLTLFMILSSSQHPKGTVPRQFTGEVVRVGVEDSFCIPCSCHWCISPHDGTISSSRTVIATVQINFLKISPTTISFNSINTDAPDASGKPSSDGEKVPPFTLASFFQWNINAIENGRRTVA